MRDALGLFGLSELKALSCLAKSAFNEEVEKDILRKNMGATFCVSLRGLREFVHTFLQIIHLHIEKHYP